MGLLVPHPNGFAGGLTRFVFDQKVSNLKVKIKGAFFHTEEDHSGSSESFTLDFNGFVSGVDLPVVLQYSLSDGSAVSESISVIKPPHDTGGMGTTVIRDRDGIAGVFFKFWLTGVKNVFIRGSFNEWKDINRMEQLGDSGYWYGFSCDARPGDDYRFFVYGHDGKFSEVSDPAARQTLKTSYNNSDAQDANAVIVDPAAFVWMHDTEYGIERKNFKRYIIYQAHWGTFLRKGSGEQPYATFVTGTNETEKRKSVRDKLAYIKSLGFTALELLPIHEANGQCNAGYDPSFFFAVETAYGTPDDLRMLVDEAHGLGLAVIFDAVINHLTADINHSSFSQEFIKGYYSRDDAPWSNNKLFGGSDWGPDPDFDRYEIRNLLTDCMIMYITEFHADGIRFDATTTIPYFALKEMILKLTSYNVFLIAEHLTDSPLPYVCGNIEFNAGWYKQAYDCLTGNVLKLPGKGKTDALCKAFESDFNGISTSAIKYMLGSHDEWWSSHGGNSICAKLGGADNSYVQMKVRLGWAINAVAIGVPMMFMGTECLSDKPWDNYNGYNDMDWYPDVASAGYKFIQMIKDINQLRTSHAAFQNGNIDSSLVHSDSSNGVLAYRRWDSSGGIFLILINISDTYWNSGEYSVRSGVSGGQWDELFNSQSSKYGGIIPSLAKSVLSDSDGTIKSVSIPQWSLLVLKQSN